jgi:hypothetical protein
MNYRERIRPKGYDPSYLLDSLIERLNLKNDSELADTLEIPPPIILKIRYGRMPVGAALLVRMHEVSELSISVLRTLMGDRRLRLRGDYSL